MRHRSPRWLRSARARDAAARATDAVRCVAFWTACVIPLAYVLLLARPPGTVTEMALGVTVAVHAAALLAGHGHDPGADA